MGFSSFLFFVIAGLTVLSALSVVCSSSLIHSATWLLFTLVGVAALFFLLESDFVAANQLLVYVGGTMVMVVFGVMLTAKGPTGSLRIPAYETLVTLLASLLFFLVLMTSLLFSRGMPANQDGNANTFSSNITTTRLGESLMGMDWANTKGNLVSTPEITIPKQQVSYLLPFEVISVHLLIVLIGASYLARARRDSGEHDNA